MNFFRRLMEAVYSKEQANYRYSGMRSPDDPRCGNCRFVVDPNGCSRVSGVIRPVDLCDLYQRKASEANPESGHAELTRHDGSGAAASFRSDLDRKKKLQQVMPTHEGISDMDADELQSWLDDNRDHLDDDEIEQIERAIALKQLGDDEESEGDEKAVETFRAQYKSGEVGYPPAKKLSEDKNYWDSFLDGPWEKKSDDPRRGPESRKDAGQSFYKAYLKGWGPDTRDDPRTDQANAWALRPRSDDPRTGAVKKESAIRTFLMPWKLSNTPPANRD